MSCLEISLSLLSLSLHMHTHACGHTRAHNLCIKTIKASRISKYFLRYLEIIGQNHYKSCSLFTLESIEKCGLYLKSRKYSILVFSQDEYKSRMFKQVDDRISPAQIGQKMRNRTLKNPFRGRSEPLFYFADKTNKLSEVSKISKHQLEVQGH